MGRTPTDEQRNRQLDRSGWVRPWMVAIVIGTAFLIFRSGAIDQPPVWDGAMGMTPAAVTLEATDFDIARLLREPGYEAGGPNVHSLGLTTWLVAVAIRIADSYEAALPALHMISFALVGILAAGVFRAVRRATSSDGIALLTAVTVIIFPPMVVQASDVYIDLPLAVALTWAFVYQLEGHLARSIALLTLAAAIKPSAVIAIPPILYIVWKSETRKTKSLFLLLPAAIAIVPFFINPVVLPGSALSIQNTLANFLATLTFLSRMPILIGLVLVVALLPLFARNRREADQQSWTILIAALLFPIAFTYFFLLNPLLSRGVTALPRYTTMFLPMLIVGFCVGLAMIGSLRTAFLGCFAVMCVFVLNLDGDLEPPSSNAFWIAERSLAYEELLQVQTDAFQIFAQHAETMPSLYDHFAHYRIEYPETGWADTRIPRGRNLNLDKHTTGGTIGNLPNRFVMLIEGNWLGGNRLQDIRDVALERHEYTVDITEIRQDEFWSQIVVVTRLADQPSPTDDEDLRPRGSELWTRSFLTQSASATSRSFRLSSATSS